jgi:hypothetical protein
MRSRRAVGYPFRVIGINNRRHRNRFLGRNSFNDQWPNSLYDSYNEMDLGLYEAHSPYRIHSYASFDDDLNDVMLDREHYRFYDYFN